jgi:hypothetical protein
MDHALVDWVDFLTKLGFPTSTIIFGMLWWIERRDRVASETQHRLDRESDKEDLREITRDAIETGKNSTFAVSALTSLLGSRRKGPGGGG